jgi:hypothetical protein
MKIIMTKIVRRITIEWNSQNWYLHLNLRDDLVKKSLNIWPIAHLWRNTEKAAGI